jgi:hypothetical protein
MVWLIHTAMKLPGFWRFLNSSKETPHFFRETVPARGRFHAVPVAHLGTGKAA